MLRWLCIPAAGDIASTDAVHVRQSSRLQQLFDNPQQVAARLGVAGRAGNRS